MKVRSSRITGSIHNTQNPMKTKLTTLIAAALVAGFTGTVAAAPPGKGLPGTKTYKHAATEEQILSIKKGDRYAVVCTDCKSITVKQAADDKEAQALCHDGGSLHCDACKQKATIKRTGPPGKGTTSTRITVVNKDGKECMFIVPMKD